RRIKRPAFVPGRGGGTALGVLLAEDHRVGRAVGKTGGQRAVCIPAHVRDAKHRLIPTIVAEAPDIAIRVRVRVPGHGGVPGRAEGLDDLRGRTIGRIAGGRVKADLESRLVQVVLLNVGQQGEVDGGVFGRAGYRVLPVGEVADGIVVVVQGQPDLLEV